MRPKDRGPHKLSSVTGKVFEWLSRRGEAFPSLLLALTRQWEGLVGAHVARNVRIGRLKDDGALVLFARTSAWMNEIRCLKYRLLKRIHGLDGGRAVRDIIVRQETGQPLDDEYGTGPGKTEDEIIVAQKRELIEKTIETIQDGDLRKMLSKVFEQAVRYGRNAP